MREKYESLALVDLKEIAKLRGIKGVSAMKKAEVIEAMLELDEQEKKQAEEKKASERGSAEEHKPAEGRRPAEERRPVSGRRESSDNRTYGNRGEGADSRTSGESRVSGDGRAPFDRNAVYDINSFPAELDSGEEANGILEVMPDGYGFIRSNNYLPGESDVYVAPSQIRRFNLKTGDILEGNTRIRTQNEKFSALLYVKAINGYAPEVASRRTAV